MGHTVIIERDNGGYRITVERGVTIAGTMSTGLIEKTAWKMSKTDALRMARVFSEFYRDENGQISFITDTTHEG